MHTKFLGEYFKSHEIPMAYKGQHRRVRVFLPKSYYEGQARYPVVYFHDGQNVFFNLESYSGVSWGVLDCMLLYEDLPEMIIVAIDNGGKDRMAEYSPWPIQSLSSASRGLSAEGHAFARFVMEGVKAFIDHNYRTQPHRESTAMIGSSGGANITAYMGAQYSQLVGRLGVFSLASWIFPEDFSQYMDQVSLDWPDQRVFIKVGTDEGEQELDPGSQHYVRQAYIDASLDYFQSLLLKGVPLEQMQLQITAGDQHTEAHWASHLHQCLRFLFQD